jgi:hypothetical protein
MTIPTSEYRGYELHAYSQKIFPTYHNPYANGPKQYVAVVQYGKDIIDGKVQADEL